ncbi:phosphomethylpyrimidine kinase/thiamin-phosphate pyrophosphorylase [Legionella wadsworthii]|uniref:Thiamine-phosphate synthase n=1 Tax=Legionella wadsworthii TaxID=28088 RepID=A0A378LR01_9GAMM|nr:thiamine phosphate synthase [Legionella wadsworthii]STY28790.1 phosphomethylpyrimidine kinase/thiamin-phosphate pyrophosphorylase [Legionella wadsworthii]
MNNVWTNTVNETDKKIFAGLGLTLLWERFDAIEQQPAAMKLSDKISGDDLQILNHYSGPVVLDFNLSSQEKEKIGGNLKQGFSFADILVLDTSEAGLILHRTILSHYAMQEAAQELIHLGVQSVLILETYAQGSNWIYSYWTNGTTSFWLNQKWFSNSKYSNFRSLLPSAITATLALGYLLQDALIVAAMYTSQTTRNFEKYACFPEDELDLPYLSEKPLYDEPQTFKRCHRLGLYPVVDSFEWIEMLLKLGVKTLQLRKKENSKYLQDEIKQSIALAKKYHATLFINDYWELALDLKAEAVHLGQSDLDTADVEAMRKQGLLLGVSTHCYSEVARTHTLGPSYIAIGPIFPTTSKKMPFSAQGIESLKRWRRTLNYPLVAIGGINLERMPEVVATGVQGVAMISAITQAIDPALATLNLLNFIKK